MEVFFSQDFIVKNIGLSRSIPISVGLTSSKLRHYHALLYISSGAKEYTFKDGTVFTAKAGDIIFIPKGTDYTVTGTVAGKSHSINFEIGNACKLSPFLFKTRNPSVFLESFKSCNMAYTGKSVGYNARCKAELYNIIYNMQKEFELSYITKDTRNRLQPALDFIHSNFTKDNISIPMLAARCKMSDSMFRLTFTNAMGLSPIKYINSLKISHAKELLSTEDCSVSEAAELSGFHDECYFSRAFKKYTGVSPKEYKML
ncbi:MAG: helix-turn-helix domain-containing protein [Clostridia bacterium]|nr:helix-turn-helix domain-containing protein [Clostridia bacterium]